MQTALSHFEEAPFTLSQIEIPSRCMQATPLIEAAEAFFHMIKMTDVYALAYLNLPSWTRPALCWLSSHLNCEAPRFSASLDTTFAVVQQLAEAYAAAHPELGIDATPDKELLGAGLGLRLLEDGLTPSDGCMLANFLRTKDKCVACSSYACMHACTWPHVTVSMQRIRLSALCAPGVCLRAQFMYPGACKLYCAVDIWYLEGDGLARASAV